MYKHEKLKETLLRDILRMSNNQKLPSRIELCRDYGAARATIDKALKELEAEGYIKSSKGHGTFAIEARRPASNEQKSWGVLIPNIMSYDYPGILCGIENVARSYGINTIVCNTDQSLEKENEYVRQLVDSKIDGIIAIPTVHRERAPQVYNLIRDRSIPLVLCNRGIDWMPQTSVVCMNNAYGGAMAARHLYKMGYRNIAYISITQYYTSVERYLGYLQALAEHGVEADMRYVCLHTPNEHIDDVYECANSLLRLNPRPDAFVCFNDEISSRVSRAVSDMGLKVSDDVGLVSFDDSPLCEAMSCKLSSVKYKHIEEGQTAAHLLYGQITGTVDKAAIRVLNPRLIERESCRGPRVER